MTSQSQKRAFSICCLVLSGALVLWLGLATSSRSTWNDLPNSSVLSKQTSEQAFTNFKSGKTDNPHTVRARSTVLNHLIQSYYSRDRTAVAQGFSDLEYQLLHSGELNPELFDDLKEAISDSTFGVDFRLGLVEALMQGASPQAIPRILDLYHSSEDKAIKTAVLNKLPDIQGNVRLIDQSINVTPELIAGYTSQSTDPVLLAALAIALTKMGDEKALGFLIDEVMSHASSVESIASCHDPRVNAAIAALTDNQIQSGKAVPYLSARLRHSEPINTETYMTIMTLSSIGNPQATQILISFFESASDGYAPIANLALGRLAYPDDQVLLRTASVQDFRSSTIKRIVESVADRFGK